MFQQQRVLLPVRAALDSCTLDDLFMRIIGATWQYEKEDGSWEAFDPMTTRLLEGTKRSTLYSLFSMQLTSLFNDCTDAGSLSNGRTNLVLSHGVYAGTYA